MFVFPLDGYLDPIPSYLDIIAAPKERTSTSGYRNIDMERSVLSAASRGLLYVIFDPPVGQNVPTFVAF